VSIPVAKLVDRTAGAALIRLLAPLRWLRDLRRDDRELRAVREIVVVKFWGIGNAALLLPVLRDLRNRYPAARLTAVTLEHNRRLFEEVADRVWTMRMSPMDAALRDFFRVGMLLRRLRADLAIDFEQYVRTSQPLLFLSGARQVLAFDTEGLARASLADVRVPYDNDRHTTESYLDLARAAGVRRARYEPGGLVPAADALARIEALVGPGGPLVVMHPGSGDNFTGRRWPTRRFGLVARRLVDERQARVVVTGSRGERPLAQEVVEASERPLLDLSGRIDLEDLVALLSRATLLVANDTGPVHLASALGVPVIGLYGPNTPHLYGPLSAGSVAFYDAPPCSPCITNFNYKTSRCLHPVCIRAIGVEEVAEAALRVVAADRRRREAGA
jgi:ADP-heptose:LPS heptosyltransferase